MNLVITKTKNFQLELKKLLFYISIFVCQYNFGQDFNEMFNPIAAIANSKAYLLNIFIIGSKNNGIRL